MNKKFIWIIIVVVAVFIIGTVAFVIHKKKQKAKDGVAQEAPAQSSQQPTALFAPAFGPRQSAAQPSLLGSPAAVQAPAASAEPVAPQAFVASSNAACNCNQYKNPIRKHNCRKKKGNFASC
jgi:hypothetical protein